MNSAAQNGAASKIATSDDDEDRASAGDHAFDLRVLLVGCSSDSERHSSTGISTLKTDHLLERAAPERREAFQQADQEGADRRARIADKAADDGADESLQPDDEAGVVVERRHRADQNAGYGAEQRREQERERRRCCAGRMPTMRAPTRLTAVARSALPASVCSKNRNSSRLNTIGRRDHQQRLRR